MNKKSLNKFYVGASGLAVAGALLGSGVQAQESSGEAAGQRELEVVLVTARKREESLLDIGASINSMSGDELASRGVVEIADLVKIQPSLKYSQSSLGTSIYTLRGVGYNDASTAAPPAVSIYQDQIPYAYPALSSAANLDVERVEILNGPQGTAYGQNSTGGAINFIAARPTDELTSGGRLNMDEYGLFSVEGYVSGALSDSFKSRLALKVDQGGAWQESTTRNDELGDKDFFAARILSEWAPTDSVDVSINLNGWRDNSESQAPQIRGFFLSTPAFGDPGGPVPTAGFVAAGGYPTDLNNILANPFAPDDNGAADWTAGTHPSRDADFYQVSTRIDWEINDTLTLTSLTSYQDYSAANELDAAGVNVVAVDNLTRTEADSIFQELRLQGGAFGGDTFWMVGMNYAVDEVEEHTNRQLTTSTGYLPTILFGGDRFRSINENSFSEVTTTSIFANVTHAITEEVELDLGIRYTESDSDLGGCVDGDASVTNFIAGPGVLQPGECYTSLPDGSRGLFETELNEDNTPWRVGLSWKPSDDVLLYTSVSKGYKAGSLPQAAAVDYKQLVPASQESLLAYEVGFKAGLMDGGLQITGAAFQYDYTDKQFFGRFIDPIFGPLFALVNVPDSEVTGFEGSVVYKPTSALTIDLAATYLDTEVTSSYQDFDGYGQPINLKGLSFPFTPELSAQAGVRYDFNVNNNVDAFVSVRGSYQDETTAVFGGEQVPIPGVPALAMDSYSLVDVTVGFLINDNIGVEIWGRNVTDEYYWNNSIYGLDQVIRITGRPSTWGLTIKGDF